MMVASPPFSALRPTLLCARELTEKLLWVTGEWSATLEAVLTQEAYKGFRFKFGVGL